MSWPSFPSRFWRSSTLSPAWRGRGSPVERGKARAATRGRNRLETSEKGWILLKASGLPIRPPYALLPEQGICHPGRLRTRVVRRAGQEPSMRERAEDGRSARHAVIAHARMPPSRHCSRAKTRARTRITCPPIPGFRGHPPLEDGCYLARDFGEFRHTFARCACVRSAAASRKCPRLAARSFCRSASGDSWEM